MAKNLLSLSSINARRFFLKQEAYTNMELPPYFIFSKILSDIENILKNGELTESDLNKAKDNETINHILYGNKDGKYAWRKYEIINPLIYVSLVNIITEDNNWKLIKNRFNDFEKNNNIECESIPIIPLSNKKQKATQISYWVENIEKKSVTLALEYNFLYQTDIADCYGSIYTHSLPWAIHTKPVSKSKRKYNDLLGNKIDKHIQSMSFGQTNGIPQGSILMDFIAEVVLGYADSKLSEKLDTEFKDKKYHILRYRDDYRIFVDDINDGDKILKYLSEILSELGFHLNIGKTYLGNDIISSSIKKDKLDAIQLRKIPKKLNKNELSKQLLIIHQIGKQYPNSGTLTMRLSKIIDSVKLNDFKYQENYIASLLTDIAYNNPKTFPLVANLISDCIFNLSKRQQKELIGKIQSKICNLANIGLLEIWMQRISIGLKFKLQFNEKLCKIVSGGTNKIFETKWISDQTIKKIIDSNSYINKEELKKMKPRIEKKEVQIFNPYYNQ